MSQQRGPMRERLRPSTWPFSLASLNKERQASPGTRTDLEHVWSEEQNRLSSNKTSAVLATCMRRRQFWLLS